MIRALAYDLIKDQKKGEVLNRSVLSPYIHEYFQVITKYVLFQVSRINSFLNNSKGKVIKKVVVEYSRTAIFILIGVRIRCCISRYSSSSIWQQSIRHNA